MTRLCGLLVILLSACAVEESPEPREPPPDPPVVAGDTIVLPYQRPMIGVGGPMPVEIIQRVVKVGLGDLDECRAGLDEEPVGTVKVDWDILASGAVAKVAISSSTVGKPSFERCILSAIATLKFPSPKGGGFVQVRRYPFEFRAR
jgi:TonB family protein